MYCHSMAKLKPASVLDFDNMCYVIQRRYIATRRGLHNLFIKKNKKKKNIIILI